MKGSIKSILILLVSVFFTILLIYLGMAFVETDFNPLNWTKEIRLLSVVLSVFGFICVHLVIDEYILIR